MSCNIDAVTILTLDAWMDARDILRLIEEHKGKLPDDCFLRKRKKKAMDSVLGGTGDGRIALVSFAWTDEGSGHSYDEVLIEKIAPKIHGRVEVVLHWETGELSGLRIVDGKVTLHKIALSLGEEETPTPKLSF